jgi:hypothetical protein
MSQIIPPTLKTVARCMPNMEDGLTGIVTKNGDSFVNFKCPDVSI